VRRDEAFVAWALVEFLGGPSVASASDGPDPPDLYLTIGGASRVGVEVTQLSQFTFEPDGTLGNRSTQDSFGLRLVDDLNDSIGPSLPEDLSLLIGLWVPVSNPARFRKLLTAWVTEIAATPEKGWKQERKIDGSRTSVSVIPERPSGKKIVGFVVNTNSSADIGLNARLVLQDGIRRKSSICAGLPKPIWLAVFNDYWLADADTYAAVARELKLTHCFERIFLVSDEGAVTELTVGA
jgi:hypothetical protein